MCSVAHVAAGALIGSFIHSGLAAFSVGILMHIPLDVIPHFDFEDFRVDAAVTVGLLGGILLVVGTSPILLGAAGAVAPDFENLLWKTGLIREKDKVFPTHSGLIRHGRARVGKGIATEVIVSACSAGVVVLAVLIGGRSN
jgi:hypothetical protein